MRIDSNSIYAKRSSLVQSLAMDTVNIHQAKTHLSQLLSRVKLGEEIMIANRGVPVAKLVPTLSPIGYTNANKLDRRSSMGIDRGLFQVPDDFNAPLNN